MAAEANFWGNQNTETIVPVLSHIVCTKMVRWFLTDNPGADYEALNREIKREFSSDNNTEELITQVTLENLLQESGDIVPVRYQKCVSDYGQWLMSQKGLNRPTLTNLESGNMDKFSMHTYGH